MDGTRIAIDRVDYRPDAGHDALMTLYRTRYSEQIELTMAAELLDGGIAGAVVRGCLRQRIKNFP